MDNILHFNFYYLLTHFFPKFQAGGDGYLFNLASRYCVDLGTSHQEVLQQLEALRLAEWSEVEPPPPTAPSSLQQQQFSNGPSRGETSTLGLATLPPLSLPGNSYVNYNPDSQATGGPRRAMGGQDGREPIYVPGTYTVSNVYENIGTVIKCIL